MMGPLRTAVVAAAATGGIIFALRIATSRKSNGINYYARFVVMLRSVHYESGTTNNIYRQCARNFKYVDSGFKPAAGHSHPAAAKARNDAVYSIRTAITKSGAPMFDPSPAASKRDTGFEVQGYRVVHSMKDFASSIVPQRQIPVDAFVTIIDQEYYFDDLSEFAGRAIAIYTLLVDNLSGRNEDSVYYFEDENQVVERVNGGAFYRQRLFDYSKDQLIIRHNTTIPRFTIYDVTRHKQPDQAKQVVFLTPVSTHLGTPNMYSILSTMLNGHPIEFPELGRMSCVYPVGHFLVGHFFTRRGTICFYKTQARRCKQLCCAHARERLPRASPLVFDCNEVVERRGSRALHA